MNVKQVLVIRKDLNMSKSEIAVQAAHASNAFLLNKIKNLRERPFEVLFTKEELYWIENNHNKICVGIHSEDEMLKLYDIAKSSGLFVSKIRHSGNNNNTLTAIAIGPDLSHLIDKVSGHLELI
jgi:PTH2 family peptidyl-tRNA hydrolase